MKRRKKLLQNSTVTGFSFDLIKDTHYKDQVVFCKLPSMYKTTIVYYSILENIIYIGCDWKTE